MARYTPAEETPKPAAKARPDFSPPYIVNPTSTHTNTIIFLHGLGNNGTSFGKTLLTTALGTSNLPLQQHLPHTKFVFPTAKRRRSSQFNRALITQWFHLHSLANPALRSDLQVQGLAESAGYIQELLKKECEVLPAENVVLAGISQGCAMSLVVLLSLEFSIGGFVGLSGWLPFCEEVEQVVCDGGLEGDIGDVFESRAEERSPVFDAINVIRDAVFMNVIDAIDGAASIRLGTGLGTPVYLGHGEKDDKIRCGYGKQASDTLTALDMGVTWRTYPELGHWFGQEEIDDIVEFLKNKVGI